MINIEQSVKNFKIQKYDRRIIKGVKNAVGVAFEQNKEGKVEIKVWVSKKLNSHRWLKKLTLEGMDVDVVETGVIKAYSVFPLFDKWRPGYGGISIGHKDITAGTLGCVVEKDGNKYILSNNHVLAKSNDGEIGDAIYQPGHYDGGNVDDTIGTLHSFHPIIFNDDEAENKVDAALCVPTNQDDIEKYIIGVGYTRGSKAMPYDVVYSISDQAPVMKTGRTSGTTFSKIFGSAPLVVIYYGAGKLAYFIDILYSSYFLADGGAFGRAGDSGSLVVDYIDGKAIGLLFAGSNTRSLWCRITEVEQALDITIPDLISPQFTAIYNDPNTGDYANQIKIQVNTANDFGGVMMWDSEWLPIPLVTQGERCSIFGYGGDELATDGTQCWWRTKFKDVNGNEGIWSTEEAHFTMEDTG